MAEGRAEAPDLTDARAARLVHSWITEELDITQSHLDLLPYVRVIKGKDDELVPARKGRLDKMGLEGDVGAGEAEDWTAAGSTEGQAADEAMRVEAA